MYYYCCIHKSSVTKRLSPLPPPKKKTLYTKHVVFLSPTSLMNGEMKRIYTLLDKKIITTMIGEDGDQFNLVELLFFRFNV